MARKKAEKEESNPEYDIYVGFIHEFEYLNKKYEGYMNGHPSPGRVYRIIKDSKGYRLHIGRDNNQVSLDGLFLGKELTGERPDFSFKIELVDKDNYLQLPIHPEDNELMTNWIETENKDLWDNLNKEASGKVPLVKSLDEFLQLIQIPPAPETGHIAHISADPTSEDDSTDEEYQVADKISKALNIISDVDAQMMMTIADLLSTVSARYTNPDMRVSDIYEVSKAFHNLIFNLTKKTS